MYKSLACNHYCLKVQLVSNVPTLLLTPITNVTLKYPLHNPRPFVICGEGMGFIVAWKSVCVCVGGGVGVGQGDSTGAVVM